MKKKITAVSELGEFKLIERITSNFPKFHKETIYGIGDDTAVLKLQNDKYTLVTTDLLVEGIHFNLVYTPLKHLGYKAVAVNLSDIAAMNGTPKYITVSIAFSAKFSVESIDDIYSGIMAACEKYNVELIGGDTSSSLSGLMISITAIGEVLPNEVCYRNAAQVGDLICVSGNLGAAYMGLLLLEREYHVFKESKNFEPDFSTKEYLLERQLKPEPRLDIIKQLKDCQIDVHAMIDISDGLSSEINHICKQSNKGAKIYSHKIPIDAVTSITSEEFNIAPETAALHGGEDYELLFTTPFKNLNKLLAIPDISIIGKITEPEEGIKLALGEDNEIDLSSKGWDAFLPKD